MNIKRFIIFLILVIKFSIFSCNQSCIDSKHIVKLNEDFIKQRFYYESGELKAERTCKISYGDTVLHGYAKLFYQSGQLQMELTYWNGKKQGFEKVYYENGRLEHVGKYKNDEQDSLWLWYYKSLQGTREPIKAIDFWSNGTPLSHQLKYYENGKEQEYLFYDPLGRLIYKRVYDENGSYKDEGSKLPLIVMVNEKNNKFNKDDILNARIYHPLPPNAESKTFVRIRGIQNEWEELKSANQYIPISFENRLNKEGIYVLEVKLKLKDIDVLKTVEFINKVEFTVQ